MRIISLCAGFFALFVGLGTARAESMNPGSPSEATGSVPAAEAPGASNPERQDVTAAAKEEAAERFVRGLKFYEDGDYGLALIEFDRAYQLVPNYRVLYNVGQVSIQLGQFARARIALTEYVRAGGETLSEARRAAVLEDMKMLEARTAQVTVVCSVVGAELLVDGTPRGKTPFEGPLLLDAGEHRIELQKSGYVRLTRHLTLAGADEKRLELPLEKQKEKESVVIIREKDEPKQSAAPVEAVTPVSESGLSAWTIGGWAGTALLGGASVTMALLGNRSSKEAERIEGAVDPSAQAHAEAVSAAKGRYLAADFLALGAVLAGGASLYFTLSPSKDEEGEVAVVVRESGLSIQGQF